MKEHHIYCHFDGAWVFIKKVPFVQNDPNHGLPKDFFDGNFQNFEVDGDKIEWWPAMGPAPHWSAKMSDFKSTEEMLASFDDWAKKTF